MTCAFCNSHGFMLCQWPVEKFVRVTYNDLEVGDRVRRAHGGATDVRPPAKVVDIRVDGAGDGPIWALFITLQIGSRKKVIHVGPSSPVRVAHPDLCGNACCSEHRREVGEEKAYCREHWNEWQQIA